MANLADSQCGQAPGKSGAERSTSGGNLSSERSGNAADSISGGLTPGASGHSMPRYRLEPGTGRHPLFYMGTAQLPLCRQYLPFNMSQRLLCCQRLWVLPQLMQRPLRWRSSQMVWMVLPSWAGRMPSPYMKYPTKRTHWLQVKTTRGCRSSTSRTRPNHCP